MASAWNRSDNFEDGFQAKNTDSENEMNDENSNPEWPTRRSLSPVTTTPASVPSSPSTAVVSDSDEEEYRKGAHAQPISFPRSTQFRTESGRISHIKGDYSPRPSGISNPDPHTSGPSTNGNKSTNGNDAEESKEEGFVCPGWPGFNLNVPKDEMNILILGETGVGKSTWINGFINYLTYSSLSEAEHGELLTLIPTKFTMTDEHFNTIQVQAGEGDQNEEFSAGQSATQTTQVYEFLVGRTKIRLLDTPGMGDTRGIDQDKKNFQNILTTLSHLNEIHGICILLKPNNARLTVMFRFCIKELLTYLHKDASRNIMFCFTNSRGTFYRPGDTMPALLSLLGDNRQVQIEVSQHTVYCFDSEAYRFLVAIKNTPPVRFPQEEKDNFSRSWEKSINETKRMLEYISTLKPHKIQNTLSLNTARELVLKLVRPLAEVGRMIQTNKKIIEDQTMEIANTRLNRRALRQNLMTDTIELEIIRLNYPKTVCSNTACKRIHSTKGGVFATEYVQVCHDHCGLAAKVAADTIGHEGLMKCSAMRGGFCKHSKCRHSYREHLHVYYESKQATRKVEDQAVKNALAKNLSDEETKELVIESKVKLISEYEEELKEIEQASVHFACFLKSNAITPYNDAMEQYLDHLIREENDKVAQGGSRQVMETLIQSKDSYLHEKNVLEQALRSTRGGVLNITPEEINKWVDKLKNLKHSGSTLKMALNCVNFAKAKMLEGSMIKRPSYPSVAYQNARRDRNFNRFNAFNRNRGTLESVNNFLQGWGISWRF